MLTDPDESFSADLSLDCCSFSLVIFLMSDIFALNISELYCEEMSASTGKCCTCH